MPARTAVRSARTRRAPIWIVILAVSLPVFMATLDNLVVTNALPVMARELGANIEELQWIVNAYTLSFATLMLLAVALGDRFGRRTVFVVGLAVFTAASAAAGLAGDPVALIAARAVQGVGAAALMPLSLTLLAGSVSERLRPAAIGIWGGVSGLGVALGPLIGGAVVEGWNWEGIFWLNVPIGLVGIPLVLAVIPESFGARVRADLPGVLLAGLGVFGLVFGIVRGNDAGWTSPEVLAGLIGGAILLAGFLVRQATAAAPLLPLRLFRGRSFTAANLVGLAFSFGIFGAVFILVQFFQVAQGDSPLDAGVKTMPWTLMPLVVAPLTGLITPRIGTRIPIVVGLALQSTAVFWIAALMDRDVAYGPLVAPFLLAGIGMGLVFAPVSTAVLAGLAEADHAKASGTNSTLREIGVALGIAVLTAVFTAAGGALTPDAFVDAAIPAVRVGGAVLVLSTVLALLLPSRRAELGARSPAAAPGSAPAAADTADPVPAAI